jgi:tRNA (cytidine/uridine-2'-O-)-methyltransferase
MKPHRAPLQMSMTDEEKALYPSVDLSSAYLKPSSGATIVLVEPQIPQNTGNITRLAACTGSALYLVGHLGFRLDDKGLQRSAMDYQDVLQPIHTYEFTDVIQAHPPETPVYYLSAKAEQSLWDVQFPPQALLVFGSETTGLPAEFIEKHGTHALRIPMVEGVRSHNLSNAVAVVLYEFLRQQGSFTP